MISPHRFSRLSGLVVLLWAAFVSCWMTTAQSLDPSLVAWWPGDGTAEDAVGNHHGTMPADPQYTPGKVGQGFLFDGANECVEIPFDASLSNGWFTVEAWVKPLSPPDDGSEGTDRPYPHQELLFGQAVGTPQLLVYDGEPGTVNLALALKDHSQVWHYFTESNTPLVIGEFSHVAASFDGTTARLYVNGQLTGESSPPNPINMSFCPFYIGGFNGRCESYGDYQEQFFHGVVDELSLFSRVLGEGEIQGIVNSGDQGKMEPIEGMVAWWRAEATLEDSLGVNHGIAKGGPLYREGVFGSSFEVDGINDYVEIPFDASMQTDAFSVDAWVKPLSEPDDLVHPFHQEHIFGQAVGSPQLLVRSGTTNSVRFLVAVKDGSQIWHYFTESSEQLPIGQFSHVAATFDGTTVRLYVNGALTGESVPPNPIGMLDCPFYIGGYSGSCGPYAYQEQFFHGQIDELRFFRRALTDAEVRVEFGILPAAWRREFFGEDWLDDAIAGPLADPDSDGASNFLEFLKGFDPTDSGSVPIEPMRVSTFAGSQPGGDDGPLLRATFYGPSTLSEASSGELFISEGYPVSEEPGGHRIRVISPEGEVSTLAGGAYPGYVDGTGSAARFFSPGKVVFDSIGNAYVADRLNHVIRQVTPEGVVTTYAGSTAGYLDSADPLEAKFHQPNALAIDAADNLYVADFENIVVRKISSAGEVSTFAGQPSVRGTQDGDRSVALFDSPNYPAIDREGNLWVSDWVNGMIRHIDTNGVVSTFATGLKYIEAVAVDAAGCVYASVPPPQHRLVKFGPDGRILWSIQNPQGFQDGPVGEARFARFGNALPLSANTILVADTLNHRIRQIELGVPPLMRILPEESLFTNAVGVTFVSEVEGANLRYTLDGEVPTVDSSLYSGAILLEEATTVSVRMFIGSAPVSDVQVRQFERVYAFGDDGIPMDWRESYFGVGYLTDPRAGADADPDQDGSTNLREYQAQTDPLDRTSGFTASLVLVPALQWPSVPGTEYRVTRIDTIGSTNLPTVVATLTATSTVTGYVDAGVADPQAFYLIEVVGE